MPKIIFCVPTVTKPYQQCLDSIAASLPLLEEAGYEHGMVSKVGSPYISCARSTMLRQALDAGADIVVFIDHDLSWEPEDMLKLVKTEGDVVAGVYRFKKDEVEYMGSLITDDQGYPISRDDGALLAHSIPAGFLKITESCVNRLIEAYPELCYGKKHSPSVDLFNHGAHQGVWWGEDYAFARRWRDCGGKVWIVPDVSLTHHTKEQAYPGNFHEFLLTQPGGSKCPAI